MTNASTARDFVDLVATLAFENVFNPYSDICPDFDRIDAAAIRRKNLSAVVEAALNGGVSSMWIARDLGYRGGRRTGLALTDEVHLEAHAQLLNAVPLRRSTRGPIASERTATVIWRMLISVHQPIFLWNVFPLHPHNAGEPMSNRPHTRVERQASRHVMLELMNLLRPSSVLAIGRDADAALTDIGVVAKTVRHPSYGGQVEFESGVRRHYGLAADSPPEVLPPVLL